MRACVSFCFFSSRRRHTRFKCDWSSDVCSSDLEVFQCLQQTPAHVLPVCCCQCLFLCCGVLGRQHEEEGCRAHRQAGEKGRSCCWHGTGLPNISGGEKDIESGACPDPQGCRC